MHLIVYMACMCTYMYVGVNAMQLYYILLTYASIYIT